MNIEQLLGKSQKNHTMWSRIKGRDLVSAPDLIDSGFISLATAEKFLSRLNEAGIITIAPGRFVTNSQPITVYRKTEEGI